MNRLFIAVLLSVLFTACGGYNEGVVQKSEKGFLKFTGKTAQIAVKIDDGTPFNYDTKNPLYQVKPGKHLVQVIRSDEIIVNRTVFVDDQAILEIEVP
jgi:hypothetical protein